MRNKKNRTSGLGMILMTMIIILSMSFTGVFAALYLSEKTQTKRLKDENERLQSELSITVLSDNVNEAENSSTAGAVEAENIDKMLLDRESEVEAAIKERMKSLVVSDDGSPLKMLRMFFPENLIYYDEEEYVFFPVDENLKKHNISGEDLVKNDNGEIQYIVDGTVLSHKGIDVSKYQGSIDWQMVKDDGIEYAFVRLGIRGYESGKIVLDDYFEQNMNGAREAGIKTGIYFFTQAVNEDEAREEAQFVLENIEGYSVECPIVLDVETVGSANGRADNLTIEERTNIAIAFCEAVKQAGYTPMVYGNIKCFTKLLDLSRLEEYEKWYAFYDDYMYLPYEVSCWQYTEKGRVSGITGRVDMNISYKEW